MSTCKSTASRGLKSDGPRSSPIFRQRAGDLRLVARAMSHVFACAMLAQADAESSLDPDAIGDQPEAFGLINCTWIASSSFANGRLFPATARRRLTRAPRQPTTSAANDHRRRPLKGRRFFFNRRTSHDQGKPRFNLAFRHLRHRLSRAWNHSWRAGGVRPDQCSRGRFPLRESRAGAAVHSRDFLDRTLLRRLRRLRLRLFAEHEFGGVQQRCWNHVSALRLCVRRERCSQQQRLRLQPEHRRQLSGGKLGARRRGFARSAGGRRYARRDFRDAGARGHAFRRAARRGLDHARRCNRQGRLAADAADCRPISAAGRRC